MRSIAYQQLARAVYHQHEVLYMFAYTAPLRVPGPNAYAKGVYGVCVGIASHSTEACELLYTLRTLADSESVALRTKYAW